MKSGFFFATLHLLCLLSFAQPKKFKNLTVNTGLSHSDVRSICADEKGLIWLATNSGLNRFDGYELIVYKHDLTNPKSLPDNRTKSIVSTQQGKLIILSETVGPFLYDIDLDQFQLVSFPGVHSPKMVELFSSRENRFFVRSSSNAIFEIKQDGEAIAQELFSLDPAVKIVSSHFLNDSFYFLSEDGVIFHFSGKSNKIESIKIGKGKVLGWSNSNDSTILFCTYKGIFKLSPDKISQLLTKDFQALSPVTDILEDQKGDLWVSFYSDGVFHFARRAKNDFSLAAHYSETNLLATNRVNDLLLDEFNELWIATSGAGVYHVSLSAKPFYEINKQGGFGLPDNYITAIHSMQEDLLVGTRKGLALVKEYRTQNHATQVLLNGKHITSILRDTSGRLLVGTRQQGLFLRSGDHFNRVTQVHSQEISGLGQDRFNRIWVSTFNDGVTLLDKEDLSRTSDTQDLLPTAHITSIHLDHTRPTAWLGTTDHGLLEIDISDPNTFQVSSYTHDRADSTSISSNHTWPISQTENGNLWIGSIGGGLNLLARSVNGQPYFERFTVNEGLPDNDVEAILVDEQGMLWLGGRGLSLFDPRQKKIVNNFNVEDGLQSNSFKIGAATRGDDGSLFFGGINGLNYFYPVEINPNNVAARLTFDQLSILNHPIKVGQTVHERVILERSLENTDHLIFKAIENEFTISLLAIHHSNPDKNKYAYKLEGYNKDWIQVSSKNRHITFANLKEGTYLLKAKVSNGDRVWSKTREISIVILPPWYLSWWALLSYAVVLFLLLFSYRYLITKHTSLQKNLNDTEYENQKNEDRLRLFTNISHEIRTPLTLIKGPLQDILDDESVDYTIQADLMIVNKNVDRLLRLANQLLDLRKYESRNINLQAAEGNIVRFIQEVYVLFRTESERRSIKLHLDTPSEEIRLTYDRDKLEVVLVNLLSNALKFTKEGGKISIKLEIVGNENEPAQYRSKKLQDNYVQISVTDTGAGMNNKELEKVFDRFYQVGSLDQLEIQGTGIGLALVKDIVLQHKGAVEVKSTKEKGSTFTIKLPLGQAHLAPEELIVGFQDSENLNAYKTILGDPVEQEMLKEPQKPDLMKPLILVVEDNQEVANYIQKSLRHKFKTKHAKNGAMGLKMAQDLLPDLVLSDVMMPEMDGIEMLQRIRKNPDISFIPVILLTARTSTLYEIQGIETGAQDYITKPFNPKVLIAKISSILGVRNKYKAYYLQELKQESPQIELPNAEYQFLEKLRKIVLENLTNEQFSVAVLTKMIGMSQSALYKRVKDLTGRSVVQFIRDVRLRKASELIKQGELSISQISYTVGMNDQKYFREKFKALFGVNPSVYLNYLNEETKEFKS